MRNFALIIGSGLVALTGCSSAMTPEDLATNESAAVLSCATGQGKNTTKAQLAVALALDAKRWAPLFDLQNGNTRVNAVSTSWVNVRRALSAQDYTADQNTFNPTNIIQDLIASFGRQSTLDTTVKGRDATKLPADRKMPPVLANGQPDHVLKYIAGPTNLGKGACGAHYVFQVNHVSGAAYTATEVANLAEGLCYFGLDSNSSSCGANAWISIMTSGLAGCPSGQQCVAIDPDWNDSGVTSDTSAGAIPQYPGNRLLDPNNAMLGTQCQMYNSNPAVLGTMQSKCATFPTTCGYLYCTKI